MRTEERRLGYPSLDRETRTAVDTCCAAFHLNRKPQTLRAWASRQIGPIRPLRINGRLAWSVAELRRLIGDRMPAVPLARQIACVERELVMRRKVYPRRVAAGAMTQSQAAGEIEAMEAVLATLRELATKEPLPLFQREEDQ